VLPRVETIDAFWQMKRQGLPEVEPTYETIEMPRNSPIGIVNAFFATITGFALIWHIWWIVIIGLLAAAVGILVFGWSENREHEISAGEIARLERARLGLGRPA
jgi:cytochrome o ubiquinol oxidase subunit I